MLTTRDKQLIINLIKKYSGNIPTGTMLAFVADTNDLLSVCKGLIKSNNQNDQQTIGWVDEQCYKHQVDVHGFLFEIERIVLIFQPGKGSATHYETLGLDEEATDDEIKRAYRKLSRKYHPDTSLSVTAANRDKFVKINTAYHALLEGELVENKVTVPTVTNRHWRHSPKSNISRTRKKKNLLWFSALAVVMIVISLVVASNYKKRVMLAGLQSSGTAFIIPPESAIKVEKPAQEQEPKEVIDSNPSSSSVTKLIVPPEENIIKEIPVEKVPKAMKLAIETTEAKTTKTVPITSSIEKTESIMSPPILTKKVVLAPKERVPNRVKIVNPPATANVKQTVRITETAVKTEFPKKIPPKVKEIPVQSPESVVSESIPSPPEETQEKTQERIERFLAAYTKSYEDKDLMSFTRFYDTKATENGKPLAEIITTYSNLFQNSETIALSFNILKWNRKQMNIHLNGRYQIYIQYKDSTQVSGKGQIFFLLSELRDRFEIKELTYKFDTQ